MLFTRLLGLYHYFMIDFYCVEFTASTKQDNLSQFTIFFVLAVKLYNFVLSPFFCDNIEIKVMIFCSLHYLLSVRPILITYYHLKKAKKAIFYKKSNSNFSMFLASTLKTGSWWLPLFLWDTIHIFEIFPFKLW